MIPRFGEPAQQGRRYTLRPGIYAILPRGPEILLTVQWADTPDVQLPGGGIDPGEPILPALHREVMEETGWKIAAPRRLGVFRRFVFMPEYDLWAEKLCSVYVAHPVRRMAPPIEPDHDPLWVPASQAPDLLGNDGDRMLLNRYLNKH